MKLGPVTVKLGDARESLRAMPADSVDVICTSPPFYALRSYLKADDPAKVYELGSEPTPELFLAALMEVFDECWRVLKPTGVCFVEFGDSYTGGGRNSGNSAENTSPKQLTNISAMDAGKMGVPDGYSAGELMNIPHRFSEAMRSRGWRWRSTMIWEKQSAMPESVNGWRWEKCKVKVEQAPRLHKGHDRLQGDYADDGKSFATGAQWQDCPGCPKCSATNGLILRKGQWRPTTAHSYVFMFAKSDRYFCDSTAAAEPAAQAGRVRADTVGGTSWEADVRHSEGSEFTGSATRNPRTILRVPNEPMDYDLCLKCGRVWRGAEKKRELRKAGKVYACTCGGTEWASHYAAFPRSLVRKLITPAISKGGCCPTCGVPWSPVVEKAKVRTWHDHDKSAEQGARQDSGGPGQDYDSGTVLCYLPSCSCPPAPSVPQAVLDPFGGTGTVGVVAAEMGLNCTLLELNRVYIPLIERRVLEVLVPKGQADAAPSPGMPLFQQQPQREGAEHEAQAEARRRQTLF